MTDNDSDETAVIPPDLAATQVRAYSNVDDYDDPAQTDTQLAPAVVLRQPWRDVWGVVAIVAMIVAVVVTGIVVWALLPPDAPPPVSAAQINGTPPPPASPGLLGDQTQPRPDDVPASQPAQAAPQQPAPAAPHAVRPDDDEFVAMAISPRAIGVPNNTGGGEGTSGLQAKAEQIALAECRASSWRVPGE